MCYHLGVVPCTGMMSQRSLHTPTALVSKALYVEASGSLHEDIFRQETPGLKPAKEFIAIDIQQKGRSGHHKC